MKSQDRWEREEGERHISLINFTPTPQSSQTIPHANDMVNLESLPRIHFLKSAPVIYQKTDKTSGMPVIDSVPLRYRQFIHTDARSYTLL